ncbi:MAG: hypothetical protein HYZ37_09685 [Candidatus Solibacter usitatus]|nr:hypothetical protein [Candidatus Solibacter usitatus]
MLPVFVAAGSALMSYFIMQARMEVALAKEREFLAEARAMIDSQDKVMVEKVKATEESIRRESLNEFLDDFRVEERHYMRENKSVFASKKAMVLQERLFFRNIPLSNWVEHEFTVEEGNSDISRLAQACSIFSAKPMAEAASASKLLA